MNDEPEESEQRRRDMIQIVWVLIPVAVFFIGSLLAAFAASWLSVGKVSKDFWR
jgi:hypothetical protein